LFRGICLFVISLRYSYLKYNPGSSVLRALDVQVRKHSESEEGFRGPESFALIPDNAGPI
jgi:hypothetical protein